MSEGGEMRWRCALMLPFWALAEKSAGFLEKSTDFRRIRIDSANQMPENEIVKGTLKYDGKILSVKTGADQTVSTH